MGSIPIKTIEAKLMLDSDIVPRKWSTRLDNLFFLIVQMLELFIYLTLTCVTATTMKIMLPTCSLHKMKLEFPRLLQFNPDLKLI
jgi:hypothetical protein